MSEKKFLNLIFVEGILLTILGLCVLLLPKLTSVTFGVMLSSTFIVYGLYKIVTAFLNRGYMSNLFLKIFMGAFVLTLGVLLLLVPKVSLLWLIALSGVYFLLESVCSASFMSQIKNVFNLWGSNAFSTIVLFLIGLVIVIGLPVISFWVVAMLCGVGFLVKGMAKNTLYLTNKNNYNI